MAHQQPGAIFGGDFRIISTLSDGGMGSVYVAEQLSTGKKRALKLMHPQLVEDARQRTRFEQEARVGARIESEHVVEVVGAGIDEATGSPWLAMELLDGSDLAKWRRQQSSVSSSEVRAILTELCHALGAAHRVGIVHRDLKPENVFVSKSRRVGAPFMIKILDFGIAKLVDEARSTQTAAIGTPLWMAPEQTESSSSITPATDVWAIGLISFWLFTGRSYWRGAQISGVSVSALLREVVMERMVAPSERAAELGAAGVLPRGFDGWFARATDRNAMARYPDAATALAALEPILQGATGTLPTAQSLPHVYPQGHGTPPQYPSYMPAPMPMQVARPRSSGVSWIVWMFVAIIVVFLGGCGALIGISLYYADHQEETCLDATQPENDRFEACEYTCGIDDDGQAETCDALGELYLLRHDSTRAQESFQKACTKGNTAACAKMTAPPASTGTSL